MRRSVVVTAAIPPPAIHYVPSRTVTDSGVACLAMLLNLTYGKALKIAEPYLRAPSARSALALETILADHNYVLAPRYRFNLHAHYERSPWPCRPFAPVHFAVVHLRGAPSRSHAIIVTGDGTVCDPDDQDRLSLQDESYRQVISITGVWRIQEDPMRSLGARRAFRTMLGAHNL